MRPFYMGSTLIISMDYLTLPLHTKKGVYCYGKYSGYIPTALMQQHFVWNHLLGYSRTRVSKNLKFGCFDPKESCPFTRLRL